MLRNWLPWIGRAPRGTRGKLPPRPASPPANAASPRPRDCSSWTSWPPRSQQRPAGPHDASHARRKPRPTAGKRPPTCGGWGNSGPTATPRKPPQQTPLPPRDTNRLPQRPWRGAPVLTNTRKTRQDQTRPPSRSAGQWRRRTPPTPLRRALRRDATQGTRPPARPPRRPVLCPKPSAASPSGARHTAPRNRPDW